jgi:hypothetical protein
MPFLELFNWKLFCELSPVRTCCLANSSWPILLSMAVIVMQWQCWGLDDDGARVIPIVDSPVCLSACLLICLSACPLDCPLHPKLLLLSPWFTGLCCLYHNSGTVTQRVEWRWPWAFDAGYPAGVIDQVDQVTGVGQSIPTLNGRCSQHPFKHLSLLLLPTPNS